MCTASTCREGCRTSGGVPQCMGVMGVMHSMDGLRGAKPQSSKAAVCCGCGCHASDLLPQGSGSRISPASSASPARHEMVAASPSALEDVAALVLRQSSSSLEDGGVEVLYASLNDHRVWKSCACAMSEGGDYKSRPCSSFRHGRRWQSLKRALLTFPAWLIVRTLNQISQVLSQVLSYRLAACPGPKGQDCR